MEDLTPSTNPEIQTPLVSVVMAVYNNQDTIARAIDSIIKQTWTDWELILIDDGSTDGTASALSDYAKREPRIVLLKNVDNCGLAYSLNKGMAVARGEFLARMDADDYSYPERLEKQVQHLRQNYHLDVLGTAARALAKSTGREKLLKMPRLHQHCLRYLAKSTPFIHPTVMMRRRFWEANQGYCENLAKAQDYELWVRGAARGCYENLDDVLLDYTLPETKSWNTVAQELNVRWRCACRHGFAIRSGYHSLRLVLAVLWYRLSLSLRAKGSNP